MLKILKYLSFFITGSFLIFVVAFLFARSLFLFMPNLFDQFVKFISDNLYLFSDLMIVLSSVAIIYSAIWARRSFWLTSKKDKIDRTIKYLEFYNERKLFIGLRFVRDKLFKDNDFITYQNSLKNPECLAEKRKEYLNKCRENYYPQVLEMLNYLDNFGLLVKNDKVDFELFYDYFVVIMGEATPNFEKYIKIFYPDNRSRRHVIFLLDKFKNFKKIDKK